jgi:hypothetical protein
MKSSAQTYRRGVECQFLRTVLVVLAATAPHMAAAEWKVQPATEWNEEVRVWDPSPELNLSFVWSGAGNANKEAQGEGTLEWRDEKGPVSIYDGELSGGKRNGDGNWLHRSGSKYSGQWKNNLKHGQGKYWLKNNDYYEGEFREDKLHGSGKYVFADGSVYEGDFVEGEKQVAGTMTFPDGRVHKSTWEKDQDTAPPPPASEPYVVLGIDNRKYALDGQVMFAGTGGDHRSYMTYRGRWTDKRFVITPDWPYWEKWQAGGPVGGAGHFDVGVFPVFLEMRIYNPSLEKLTVATAEIEVQSSLPDTEPILQVGDGSSWATLSVDVSSFYRQPVESFEISYDLLPAGSDAKFGNYRFQIKVPTFSDATTFSVEDAIAKLGGDISMFKEWQALTEEAQSGKPNTDFESLEKRKQTLLDKIRKNLAPLQEFAVIDKDSNTLTLEARFVGEMEVRWTGVEGEKKSKTIKLDFPKVFFVSSIEMGAGGPESGTYEVLLETSGKNYVRPFAYKRTLEPGANDRFGIQLASAASSFQQFRVRLTTTDGRELVSPQCDMHFLVPGGFDWSSGFRVRD